MRSVTRREQAKAAELTAAGEPVTASAITKRRRRYEAGGGVAMFDQRITKLLEAKDNLQHMLAGQCPAHR